MSEKVHPLAISGLEARRTTLCYSRVFDKDINNFEQFQMERDAKGRFIKGNDEGRKISGGVAAEMQERSVASRKEHRTTAALVHAKEIASK